jgi:PKD repeat protein
VAEDDGSAILPLDERVDAYTTASYDHRQFQHPALAAFGQNVTTDEDTPVGLTLGAESSLPGALSFSIVSAPSHGVLSGTAPHLTYTPEPDFNGPDLFTFSVSNGTTDSEIASVFITVNPVNDPPVANAGGPFAANEGDQITLDASRSTDPDADGEITRYEWDLDNDGAFDDATGATITTVFGDQGTYLVGLRVTDDLGAQATASTQVVVSNVAPAVGAISAPSAPVAVGTAVSVSASFSDPGLIDTHTAVWDWNDGTTSAGTVLETSRAKSVSGTHTYTTAGVYTVRLTVTDKDGAVGTAVLQNVVIYDPNGGFVAGGGWFTSPAGSSSDNPSLTGRANFGFVSEYRNGASVPAGQTEFAFQLADLSFHSTSYQWLVFAEARAQLKGVGQVNGAGSYGLLITAVDGQLGGGGGVDRVRVKIWDAASGRVIYDNQPGAPDNASPSTSILGGAIVIHSR